MNTTFTAVVLLLLSLASFFAPTQLSKNLWSVQYLNVFFDPALTSSDLPPVPEGRPTRDLWMAKLALVEGRYDDVLAASQEPAVNGSVMARNLVRQAGQGYWEQGNLLKAIKTWAVINDTELAFFAAEIARRQGQIEEALIAYEGAYGFDSEATALRLANFLHNQNRTSDAISVLHDALLQNQKSPVREQWLERLAALYLHQKDWPGLSEAITQLRREYPENSQSYIYLGWMLHDRDGDTGVAVEQFERAIELAPRDGRNHYAMALLYYSEEEYAQAISFAEQAVSLGPLERYYQLILANSYRDAGQLSISLLFYSELINRNPNWAPGYYEQALAFRLNSQPEQAIDSIRNSLLFAESPNQDYFWQAGSILEWAGQIDEAVKMYEFVIKLDSNRKDAATAIQRLR